MPLVSSCNANGTKRPGEFVSLKGTFTAIGFLRICPPLTFAATFPASEPRYAGSARYSPKHVHFQAVPTSVHLTASLKVCYWI